MKTLTLPLKKKWFDMTKTGDDDAAQVYLKSEADKVIADLEESHKKEVGQLLIEIAELKDKLRHYPMMAALIETGNKDINKQKDLNHALMLDALRDRDRIRHLKYKRCLAMADKCVDLCHKAKDLYHWAEDENLEHHYNHKIEFFARWHNRWLEIAKQFKESK